MSLRQMAIRRNLLKMWRITVNSRLRLPLLLLLLLMLVGLHVHHRCPAATSSLDTWDSWLKEIDCSDPVCVRAKSKRFQKFLHPSSIIQRTQNCTDYFLNAPQSPFVSSNKKFYPLAFGHSVHLQPAILEAFLLTSFDPRDSHCVHIDADADPLVRLATVNLVNCYREKYDNSNVFVAKKSLDVVWGTFSVLEADLVCLQELLEVDDNWKSFLNPAATELPIRSLHHVRATLANMRGSAVSHERPTPNWVQNVHVVKKLNEDGGFTLLDTGKRKSPVPFNLTVIKSSKNVALIRNMAEFVSYHPVARQYLEWMRDIKVPDEHFYATMASIRVEPSPNDELIVKQQDVSHWLSEGWEEDVCVRYSLWEKEKLFFLSKCYGEVIRYVCHFALEDLPNVRQSPCLFGNKFDLDVDSGAVLCQAKHLLDSQKQSFM